MEDVVTLDNIKEEIERASTIALLTHEYPDGDAMGSTLGMYNALKIMGKRVDAIVPEFARTFEFLPGANEIKKEPYFPEYDLVIALDCADLKRLNGAKNIFENAKMTISIDHHGINSMFANINYVNPASPACAQILVSIFDYWNIDITKEIGECLITGIITDTGGFKYSNVTVETFDFAAELLSKGINISKIYERVMQTITKSRFELTRIANNRLEILENGKIAFTYVKKEDEEKVNTEPGDYEGIVEQGRSIEGVEVSVFLRETDKGYKVSLRSGQYLNVADICYIFGGGGHEKAAGCTMPYSLEVSKEKILNEIKLRLNNEK